MVGAPRREADIQRAILAYLALCPQIYAVRQNAGRMLLEHKGRRRMVKLGAPGQSDIAGYIRQAPWPRPFYFEVKRPGEMPTPRQQAYLLQRAADGCLAATVTSVEDVQQVLGSKEP